MSSYSELIKNFERIRAYMREFYVYGIKSREEYTKKSTRTYDDERRRLESWLGDHMSYVRTPEGKSVYISIDSRTTDHNPLHKAWKSKSFTDGDITLHFIIFDILYSPDVELSVPELIEIIDEKYLSGFCEPMTFDESTVRKKLKEYCELGLLESHKEGKRLLYRRVKEDMPLPDRSLLNFYSEVAPCGVIGSFILDKTEDDTHPFEFKHHYITDTLDSNVLALLFDAMRRKCAVTVSNMSRRRDEPRKATLVPLRIFISTQSGRHHLIAYQPEFNSIRTFRVDYLSGVKIEGEEPRFDEFRAMLDDMQKHMWGVNIKRKQGENQLEHVEFVIRIESGEDYIVKRLEREKRVGRVEKIDEFTYKFSADVYDTMELHTWIRTFICRIVQLDFSNRTAENRFREDIEAMYRIYGLSGGEDE